MPTDAVLCLSQPLHRSFSISLAVVPSFSLLSPGTGLWVVGCGPGLTSAKGAYVSSCAKGGLFRHC